MSGKSKSTLGELLGIYNVKKDKTDSVILYLYIKQFALNKLNNTSLLGGLQLTTSSLWLLAWIFKGSFIK